MTQEEKAKAYDEALKRAKELATDLPNGRNDRLYYVDDLEHIFPELAESEDEKIKKALIEYFNEQCDMSDWNGVYGYQIVAWLEKQVEQKPADKVETKFNAGDWIVFNGLTLLVNEVVQGYYRTITIGGIRNSYDWGIDNVARLWTIQDAKDGDVLAFDNTLSGYHSIGIFKRLATNREVCCNTYRCYVRYGGFKEEYEFEIAENNSELHHCGTSACPATKEQRDLLFSKMKEAGYEWDAEKKELRKIEQKPVEWSEEDEQYFLVCKNALSKYQISDKWDSSIISRWLEERLKSTHSQKQVTLNEALFKQEVEYWFGQVLCHYENNGCPDDKMNEYAKHFVEKATKKLLSLQNIWKPTEEQLKAIKYAKSRLPNTEVGMYKEEVLEELLEQLEDL